VFVHHDTCCQDGALCDANQADESSIDRFVNNDLLKCSHGNPIEIN
jgi:hypothetical protein